MFAAMEASLLHEVIICCLLPSLLWLEIFRSVRIGGVYSHNLRYKNSYLLLKIALQT